MVAEAAAHRMHVEGNQPPKSVHATPHSSVVVEDGARAGEVELAQPYTNYVLVVDVGRFRRGPTLEDSEFLREEGRVRTPTTQFRVGHVFARFTNTIAEE